MRALTFPRSLAVMLLGASLSLAACAPAALPVDQVRSVRPALHETPQATPTSALGSGLTAIAVSPDTETLLESVSIPPRDRIALARRLFGVETFSTPPAASARQWTVGDVALFWVDSVAGSAKFQVEARLRCVAEHVYMWVQADAGVDEEALCRSAEVFSAQTYPAVREVFGSEWSPGIDGDPRIYILHAAGLGDDIAAYFVGESEYPPEAVSTSNGHEVFFVNLDTMAESIGTTYYDAVLAHEFQHMIHWNVDLNEDTWLNEGLSELAALLAGYDDSGYAVEFLAQPTTQLNAWPQHNSRLPSYGGSFLFTTYFYERFGVEAMRQLVADPANGLISVRDTLRRIEAADPLTGQPVTVDDLFADWLIANLLNDADAADGRYGYRLLDPALPGAAITEEIDIYPHTQVGISLPQYSAHYLRLSSYGPRTVRFAFQGSDRARLVPVDPHSGSRMWYSNRGDNSDATLTRAFDLTGVQTATLDFYTWYDIEYLWDYAYVMVSTDGGATWSILRTGHTSNENPHNNAYGPGYTGSSGSDLLGPVGWLHEQVDLTPFAGQQILLRFELITDEAVAQPGMVIDDLGIPEIGYFEDFEKGPGGWAAEGWIYTDNVLAQRWIVQQVTRSADGVLVTRLLAPGEGVSGTWTFDVGGPAGDVLLAISPLAPVTTQAAQYGYTLAAE